MLAFDQQEAEAHTSFMNSSSPLSVTVGHCPHWSVNMIFRDLDTLGLILHYPIAY